MSTEVVAVPVVDVPIVEAAAVAPVVVEPVSTEKSFTYEELKGLTDKKDLHMLIHGKVYAITKFMDEVS